MNSVVLGELTIEVQETPAELQMVWRGRSTDREPDLVLTPFLEMIFARRAGRSISLDLQGLAYMNSSTLIPIMKLVKRCMSESISLTVRYSTAIRWQKTPCQALARMVRNAEHIVFEGL